MSRDGFYGIDQSATSAQGLENTLPLMYTAGNFRQRKIVKSDCQAVRTRQEFILAGGHVRASAGDLTVHGALRCNAAFAILYCAEAAVPESIVRLYAVVTVTDLVTRPRGR